jgi:serine/threonine-protein kinase RsbW
MGAAASTPDSDSSALIRLTIASRLELLALVHALIEGLARQYDLDEETAGALQIAVIEAGTNAIQHGNAFAEDKSVTFEFSVGSDGIVVQVDDYGKGFDPSRVEDPTDPSALLNPHGRGLFLMRSLMDDVTFDTRADHGTRVRLRKARLTSPR